VILDGTIVSQAALSGGGGGVSIQLRGGVQIVPGSTLPGCAIVAPDAAVTGDGTERVQIQGAIVAGSIALPGSGAVHGGLACAGDPVLGTGVDRPGNGRTPRDWPAVLESSSAGVGRLAFDGVEPTDTEKNAIRGFAFPARRAAAADGPAAPDRGP